MVKAQRLQRFFLGDVLDAMESSESNAAWRRDELMQEAGALVGLRVTGANIAWLRN